MLTIFPSMEFLRMMEKLAQSLLWFRFGRGLKHKRTQLVRPFNKGD